MSDLKQQINHLEPALNEPHFIKYIIPYPPANVVLT